MFPNYSTEVALRGLMRCHMAEEDEFVTVSGQLSESEACRIDSTAEGPPWGRNIL
jgi:hypothetical protein